MPKVMKGLREKGKVDAMVLIGGVIMRSHIEELMKTGIDKVFLPGTPPREIADYIKGNITSHGALAE